MVKPLPIGIQTFRKIIQGDYLYVDKTSWLYELIRYPYGVYFLSRPRRFGKSLLISTLEEIFLGNKELFQGLWLYDSPYQWEQHPVIRVDFSRQRVRSAQELETVISSFLQRIGRQNGVTIEGHNYLAQFQDLIFKLAWF